MPQFQSSTILRWVLGAFCAIFGLRPLGRRVPVFRAMIFWALDDEEFFVVEGRGVALTPGVKLPGVGPPRCAN